MCLTLSAAKFIEAQGLHPYYLAVAFNAPHTPLQAKRSDYESLELEHILDHKHRVYAAMIKV